MIRKIRYLPAKLILTAAYLAFAALWYIHDMPCVFRAALGIRCPGCGTTRAWLAALGGRLPEAFSYNPLFWAVPVLYIFILYDGHVTGSKRLNGVILFTILAGYLALFLLRLLPINQ